MRISLDWILCFVTPFIIFFSLVDEAHCDPQDLLSYSQQQQLQLQQEQISQLGESPTTSSTSEDGILSEWARTTKRDFLIDLTNNRADQWIIVMGNESGDTDSMAAAIAWAYHLSHQKTHKHTTTGQKSIALLQTVEDALDLRPENQLALDASKMAPRHRDLLTIDELPIKPFELSRHLHGIVIVDHNHPTAGWENARILSIIDHHVDRMTNLSATPRLIQSSAASCSSLVAKLILDSLHPETTGDLTDPLSEYEKNSKKKSNDTYSYRFPEDLIGLLLRAIALDSEGLDHDHSFEVDRKSATGLFRLSRDYPSPPHRSGQHWEKRALRKLMTNRWAEMSDARAELGTLDLRDLFRRDWKANSVKTQTPEYPFIRLGFGSIPYSMAVQTHRTPEHTVPEWFAIERAFTSEIGADVSVILSKSRSSVTGKREREIILVVAHGWGKRLTSKAADDLFETLCRAIEDGMQNGLENWSRPDGKGMLARRKGWIVRGNNQVGAGRKMVMPLVQDALGNWTWTSK